LLMLLEPEICSLPLGADDIFSNRMLFNVQNFCLYNT
jgi:hypothetical protein